MGRHWNPYVPFNISPYHALWQITDWYEIVWMSLYSSCCPSALSDSSYFQLLFPFVSVLLNCHCLQCFVLNTRVQNSNIKMRMLTENSKEAWLQCHHPNIIAMSVICKWEEVLEQSIIPHKVKCLPYHGYGLQVIAILLRHFFSKWQALMLRIFPHCHCVTWLHLFLKVMDP